jgi:hypothetical protein
MLAQVDKDIYRFKEIRTYRVRSYLEQAREQKQPSKWQRLAHNLQKMPKRNFLTIKKKRDIVREAYQVGASIKATAARFRVSPAQIRRWKHSIGFPNESPHQGPTDSASGGNASTETDEANTDEDTGHKKTLHSGARPKNVSSFEALKEFFHFQREMDRPVSKTCLALKLKQISEDPSALNILYQRVNRWCQSEDLVLRRVTHVAQNTRFDTVKIEKYLKYINRSIVIGNYKADAIVNIDETNVYFDMTAGYTLEARG